MITKKFYLKNNDEVIKILGPQDVYLKEMEKEFKVSIFVNHNKENESASLTIKGKQRNVDKTVNMLEYMLKKYYEKILKPAEMEEQKGHEEEEKPDKNSIYRTEFGEIIKAKTENQKNYIKTILENDIVISIGPAGTGKTFLASTVALRLLKEKKIRKIV
ncbi:MAG TPA: PhoH family protein, partial [Elusimicrobiales bacterium]|nr:PhoH family protein [Elusimicrobiales bacterium]